MDIDAFALRLQTLRLEKGLSTRQLDLAAGIATSTTSKLETGKRKTIGYSIVEALAKALGTTPEHLNGGEAPEPAPDLRSPVLAPLLGYVEAYMVRANAQEMSFRRTATGMTVTISAEQLPRGRAGRRG